MAVVVIVRGTSGFGFELARQLVLLGAQVAIAGRDVQTAQAAAEAIDETRVLGIGCDVRDEQQLAALWTSAVERFGMVDHWINNAAIGASSRDMADCEPDLVRDMIATNLTGVFLGTSVAVIGMRAQGHGMVWCTEGLGSEGLVLRGASLYGATKAGATYAYKVLVKECKGSTVRAGYLRPGIMPTRLALGDFANPDPRAAWINGLLGDEPEAVAKWMAPRLLVARENGTRLNWLGPLRLARNFIRAGPALARGAL